jgi:hypothetical protein
MGVTCGRAMVRGKCRIGSWRGRVVLGTSLRILGILLALDGQRRVLIINSSRYSLGIALSGR